ncbi:MAG: hypothetical protein HOW73_47485 [Polyangiaceae bacterium]|nr:hypothetical protein [Polyangiaceae bacterium]
MSLSDPKPSGFSVKERLLSSTMNAFRTELLKCPDFVGGGNYTPAVAVGLAGQGLSVPNSKLNVAGSTLLEYVTPVASVEYALQDFGDNGGGSVRYPFSASIAAGALTRFPVRLPDGVTITGFKVDVVRSAGVPVTEATAVLGYNDFVGGSTTVASQAAAAGTGATTITATGLSHAFFPAIRHYFIEIQGEAGGTANTVTLTGIRMVFTTLGLSLLRG